LDISAVGVVLEGEEIVIGGGAEDHELEVGGLVDGRAWRDPYGIGLIAEQEGAEHNHGEEVALLPL
jgi:hypothetical protein